MLHSDFAVEPELEPKILQNSSHARLCMDVASWARLDGENVPPPLCGSFPEVNTKGSLGFLFKMQVTALQVLCVPSLSIPSLSIPSGQRENGKEGRFLRTEAAIQTLPPDFPEQ
jgi:hypothetical protein